MLELRFAGSGETQPAFSPVFPTAFRDPVLADHDCQCASEGGAVDREHCSQLALGHLSGQGEKLEDGELGGAQASRSKGLVIELSKGTGCAAEIAAHARQNWKVAFGHGHIDAYTSILVTESKKGILPGSCASRLDPMWRWARSEDRLPEFAGASLQSVGDRGGLGESELDVITDYCVLRNDAGPEPRAGSRGARR